MITTVNGNCLHRAQEQLLAVRHWISVRSMRRGIHCSGNCKLLYALSLYCLSAVPQWVGHNYAFLLVVQLMMRIKFNFRPNARVVCHSLVVCQRHTPSSLAAVFGLSNNDVISLRSVCSLRCVHCVGWKRRLTNTCLRQIRKVGLEPRAGLSHSSTQLLRFVVYLLSATTDVQHSQHLEMSRCSCPMEVMWYMICYVMWRKWPFPSSSQKITTYGPDS